TDRARGWLGAHSGQARARHRGRSRHARSLPRLSGTLYARARVRQYCGDRALEPRRVAVARDAPERIGTQALPQRGLAMQPQALRGEIARRRRDQDLALVAPAEL